MKQNIARCRVFAQSTGKSQFITGGATSAERLNLSLVFQVERRFADQGGVPILDPIEDMCIEDESFKKTTRRVEAVQGRIQAHRLESPMP
jgi:hypothetical protein